MIFFVVIGAAIVYALVRGSIVPSALSRDPVVQGCSKIPMKTNTERHETALRA